MKKPKGVGTKGLSIRAFEAFGNEVEAEFVFPWPAIVRSSDIREGLGRVIAGKADRITIHFKPHQIVTIHVQKIDEEP